MAIAVVSIENFYLVVLKVLWLSSAWIKNLAIVVNENKTCQKESLLTLSWRRLLSYKNQSIGLLCKWMDWFQYDNGPRHEELMAHLYG